MIHVVASIEVVEGQLETFLAHFQHNRPFVLEEKGCLQYDPTVDHSLDLAVQDLSPSRVTVVERWESEEDLRAHFKAPHMDVYREKVKDLVAGVSLRVLKGTPG